MGIPATRHRTNQNPFWGYNVMEIRRMDILQRGENPHALIECLICGHVSTATFPSVPAVEWLGVQVGTSGSLPPPRENALRASTTVPLRSCCTVLALVDYLRLLQHSTVGDNPPSVIFLHLWSFTTIAKVSVNRNLFFFNSDASLATVALFLDFHTKVACRKTAWTSSALFYISYVLSDAFEAIVSV
jgi:hypothetical protein